MKKVLILSLYALTFLTVCVNSVFMLHASLFPDIQKLPEGRLQESIKNEKNDNVLNVYVVETGIGTGIRAELQNGGKRTNIYWQTDISEVECFWESKDVAVIGDKYLNVSRGDIYDCRNGISILQSEGTAPVATEE